MHPLNKDEKKVMDLLIEAHNEFVDIEQTHPDDIKEWVFHLHGLQKILGQRILRRDYPETFPTYKKDE